MALIKCPECGKEMTDAVKSCPHCGYNIGKKQQIKIFATFAGVVALICIVCAVKLFGDSGNPAKQAIKIIEADYGENISIISVFYNEEQNGCIIEFTNGGASDVACIHLDDKSIGYESVYEDILEKSNDLFLSDEEKQKYAMQIIEYPYDAVWVYNLFMNGTSGSNWEKLQ